METRAITFQMLQFICEHNYSEQRKLYCRNCDLSDAYKYMACAVENCPVWRKLRRGDDSDR